ncbi:hypothetical protein SSX86_021419 [Deinandra increscens subsp. villosa]|uniref:Uncharacterized protein n=1 Tax=Deinandra increscens subsp. villosa TaxID=3103831 RepID=A0AAP0CWS3_9ASTR
MRWSEKNYLSVNGISILSPQTFRSVSLTFHHPIQSVGEERESMSSLSRELVFLILQFLDEEKFKETVHRLEQESGFFFNIRYFEEMVTNGEWDEVEKYLSGFTKVDDNRYSMKIFFEIRKQKYLEALDKKDRAKAVEILVKDLKVFSAFNEDLFKEITQLLTLENFRDNEQLSKYGDTKSARGIMLGELKKLIEANPLFRDKLNFPTLKNSRLRTLINQSLNWQHQLCKNPKPNPDIKTLFVDHSCGQSQPNGARAPSPVNNPLMGAVPKPAGFPPLGAHGPFQPAPSTLSTSLAGWMANPSTVPHPSASAGPLGFNPPSNSAILKRPRTPPTNNPAVDYQTADSDHVLKRTRTFGISEEVNHLPVNILPVGYSGQSHGQSPYSSDDLPKTVVMTLNQGSVVKSMDFHPLKQNFLLVGTSTGEIMIWELGIREKLAHKNFKIWDHSTFSMPLQVCIIALTKINYIWIHLDSLTVDSLCQASLTSDYTASINRVTWSPDGTLFGVAYSKYVVQIYSYHGGDDLRNHLEIEAHVGSVNDLAFSYPDKQLCIVTCGEDRLIKVWDAATGAKQFTFDGHEAPVYSVCPHFKETIQFIFSTATDGKIKAWLYDNMGSRVDYDAPGHSSTKMAYNADGTRLFSCGTNKEGESYIVEWNESEGAVKRTYNGLGKRSVGIVQFDTTKRFLAAGDEFLIKFWDMDSVNMLTTVDADGGLPASPCIRFNKGGILLAVSTNDNGIKILANPEGVRLLRTMENRSSFDPSRVASASNVKTSAMTTFGSSNPSAGPSIMDRVTPMSSMVAMNGDNRSLVDVKPRIGDESMEKSRIWKLTEITEPSQCRSLRLPDTTSSAMRVSRLIYTNSGLAILALAANAVHKLWKWQRNDRNSSGKATANVVPQLWQPTSGILMTNVISDTNPEEAVPCFALSKNDSYVMSASGGKISLFNMMTFKTMTTFMPPPPAATFLAFHPQDNNIIAIGMEDSSIQIYNVRIDEVKTKLKGHNKRITGLAFSNVLNVLVSSGADSQLCVWSTEGWEKQTNRNLQIPPGRVAAPIVDTRVQFHHDQTQLLVVHETQIAIYEAPKLERLRQWVPPEANGLITHATYSCDSQSIYVSFEDSSVGILTASSLRLRCRVTSSSYLPTNPPNSRVYPLVIAAHPTEPNQFALGLTDGGVIVLEPLESEGKWGTSPPLENGAGPSSLPAGATSTTDQAARWFISMSSSTIRKAIGVVKDQTSISIAKVAGNVAPDLEVVIVKATGHDSEPAEEKYIREILHLISQSRGYVRACVYNISKRLSKTHDWVVALKVLMLVHRLLVDGDPVFGQEMMYASRKGTRVLNMSDFRVEALSNYWDHSGFVKNYALYLDQKLEFIAFERKLSPIGFRDDHGYGISHKSKSYGDLYESVVRADKKEKKVAMTPVREMKADRVLERLTKLLRLIDRVLSCRPTGNAKSSKMVLAALYLVLNESFWIYADICEALGVLLDRFPEMEYGNCVKTFDQYVNAAKTIDELVDFYSWSKELGVARASEFPEVQKVTDKILGTLERFLREKKNKLKKKMEEGYKENGPSPSPSAIVAATEDLLNLKDDDIVPAAANHGNTLAVSLFSGPKTVETMGSWNVLSSTIESDKAAVWRPGGKADWELALVESTSNPSGNTAAGGGLDPVMLNDMYDQVSAPPVLALPAPIEKVQPVVDPRDPFAASLMVPPPPYVQLADLEKRKGFLVQEQQQQVWQPYGSNVGKINGMGKHSQAGYNYAHY